MDAENRRHFYGALKSLPIFRANRAGNATWADHRQSLENWITLYQIDRVADIDLVKTAICHSLQDAAARAIRIYGPGTAGFAEANTTVDYLKYTYQNANHLVHLIYRSSGIRIKNRF